VDSELFGESVVARYVHSDTGPRRVSDTGLRLIRCVAGGMDTATEVLAFRLTYGITNPAVALGSPPTEEHPQHRREWYRDLNRLLVTLRE
jgi:hypothetical protein